MAKTPWLDIHTQVGFDVPFRYHGDTEKVERYLDGSCKQYIPTGWTFMGVTQNWACGYVAEFEVEGRPTLKAGRHIAQLIAEILALDEYPLCASCRKMGQEKFTWLCELDNVAEKMPSDGWLFRHTCLGGNCVCDSKSQNPHSLFEDDA